jgi:hypothetical protein
MEFKKRYNKREFVTKNDYFKFQIVKTTYLKKLISKIFELLNNILLKLFGLRIVKDLQIHAEHTSFILDKDLKKIKYDLLSIELQRFFFQGGLFCNISELRKFIEDYDCMFRTLDIKNNIGGMSYNSGLVTYIFLSIIKPEIVYESGVWKGFTTALLDKSTTNDCRILCFDITLQNLVFKSDRALYFERDISEIDLSKYSKYKSAALFDDHVSHLERLLWCKEHKIKFAIFDDDVSPLSIHSDGWPPVPTLNMLFNYERLPKKFEWFSNNRFGKADISGIDTTELFKQYHYLQIPDLFSFTGYRNTSETSFIISK